MSALNLLLTIIILKAVFPVFLPQKLYLPLGATSNSDMHLTMILGLMFRLAAIWLPIKLGRSRNWKLPTSRCYWRR